LPAPRARPRRGPRRAVARPAVPARAACRRLAPLKCLLAAALRRAEDRVAHERTAIAVLERRAVGCDSPVAGDRVQQVQVLVRERVSPTDDVPGRPPVAVLE